VGQLPPRVETDRKNLRSHTATRLPFPPLSSDISSISWSCASPRRGEMLDRARTAQLMRSVLVSSVILLYDCKPGTLDI
jgi:hypothetical protein